MGKCQLGNNTSNIDDNRQHFIFFEQTACTYTLHLHCTHINLIYNVGTRNTLCFIKYCGVCSYFIESQRDVVCCIRTSNHTIQSTNPQIDTRKLKLHSSQKMMLLLFNLPKMPKTKVNWLSFLLLLL